jgi:hypothetical protein
MVLRNGIGEGHQTCSQGFKSALKACNVEVNNSSKAEGWHDSWREKKTSGGLDRVFIRKCNHIHSVATLPLPCTTTTVSNKTVAMFV